MSTTDRKLEALESVLTGRQRAALVIRAARAGEVPDERLDRLCPPQDRVEFDGIIATLEKGHIRLYQTLMILLEWLAQTEIELHWLVTLEAYQAREKAIPAAQRRGLPPLPAVWDGKRSVARVWGDELPDEGEPPQSWEGFRVRLAGDVERNLQARWQECLRMEAAFDEASAALGTDIAHPLVRDALKGFREGITGLARAMTSHGYKVDLKDLDPDEESFAGSAFNLAVLRGWPGDKHAREWLSEKQREELEAWEREQLEFFRTK